MGSKALLFLFGSEMYSQSPRKTCPCTDWPELGHMSTLNCKRSWEVNRFEPIMTSPLVLCTLVLLTAGKRESWRELGCCKIALHARNRGRKSKSKKSEKMEAIVMNQQKIVLVRSSLCNISYIDFKVNCSRNVDFVHLWSQNHYWGHTQIRHTYPG